MGFPLYFNKEKKWTSQVARDYVFIGCDLLVKTLYIYIYLCK